MRKCFKPIRIIYELKPHIFGHSFLTIFVNVTDCTTCIIEVNLFFTVIIFPFDSLSKTLEKKSMCQKKSKNFSRMFQDQKTQFKLYFTKIFVHIT